MTQFILNDSARAGHPFYNLSDFAKGYVEAMFFTNCDNGDDGVSANHLGIERLTRASVKAIKRDCDAFLSHIMPDGCTARHWIDKLSALDSPRYGNGCSDDRRAGHFFWYARQGHGVSWTDDYASDIADGLIAASQLFGECYPEISRGWIYYR